jgi:hypothetical protein
LGVFQWRCTASTSKVLKGLRCASDRGIGIVRGRHRRGQAQAARCPHHDLHHRNRVQMQIAQQPMVITYRYDRQLCPCCDQLTDDV